MKTKKNYESIDLCKFIFSILIVLLHINFGNNLIIDIIKEYISRLGVPYFFTASGFFLSKKLNTNEIAIDVLKKYLKRILLIFGFWSLLYAPYHIITLYIEKGNMLITVITYIQMIIFIAPSYMWYLVALAVAAIPFCLLFKRKFYLMFIVAIILYIFGTIGNSYKDILELNFYDVYLKFFLTTRNGLFFAPLFLCIGGIVQKTENKFLNNKIIFIMLPVLYLFFAYEVHFVLSQVTYGQDTSMYFMLPAVIYCLFVLTIKENNGIKNVLCITFLRKASTGIYCSQFGFILFYNIILKLLGVYDYTAFYVYCLVILSGIIMTYLIIKSQNKFIDKFI